MTSPVEPSAAPAPPADPLSDEGPSTGLITAARWALPLYWIALAVGTHWPRLSLHTDQRQTLFEIDKVAHVSAFGLLALGLFLALPRSLRVPTGLKRALPAGRGEAVGRAWLAMGIAAAYAVLDEVTQPWTGRELHVSDAVASLMGIAAATLAVFPRPAPGAYRKAVAWIARALTILALPGLLYLTLEASAQPKLLELYEAIGVTSRQGDGLLHAWLAGAVTLALGVAAWLGLRRRGLAAAVTVGVMLGSARLIEWAQIRTGRANYMDPRDIVAHETGVVWAVTLWTLLVVTGPLWAAGGRYGLAVLGLGSSSPGGAGPERGESERVVGHAATVSGLTLVSRLSGLLRDAVLARFLGLSVAADAFFVGFLVPNLFRRLFGEGALSAAFIPRYAKLREADPALARRFVTAVIAALAALLAGLTLLGEAALWAAAQWSGWSERAALAIELTRWMLPYMPLVCVVAVLGGVLQVHRRFAPAAAAPILLNLGIIGACVWAGLFGDDGDRGRAIAVTTAVGVLIAGTLQLAWLWVAAWRVARPAWAVRGTAEPLRRTMRVMGPMVVGLAVYQLNALLDTLIAFALSAPVPDPGVAPASAGAASFSVFGRAIAYPMLAGDVAALQWSQRLYQFPLGVFGIAIATAIFPALAAAAGRESPPDPGRPHTGNGDTPAVRESDTFAGILRRGLRLTGFIGLPAAVGLVLVREPLVAAVFERGAFEAADVTRVATILTGYAVGVWAFTASQVLTRGHYAREDSVTPMRIALAMVGFNAALNLVLIWPMGAAGLAWSTAASGTLHAVLLGRTLQRRTAGVVDRGVVGSWGRSAAGTLLMLAAAWPALNWAAPRFNAWGTLAVVVPLAVAVYLAAAALMSGGELRTLLRRK